MDDAIRILLVEDLPTDAALAEREIRKAVKQSVFHCVDNQPEFLSALADFLPDIIVTDYRMPQFDGLTAMRLSLERNPLIPVIILTSAINEDTAVECMKSGASDYVIKEHIKRLGQAVLHALDQKKIRTARMQAENELRIRDYAIKSTISAIGFADLSGTVIYVNDAFRRMWKYSSDNEIIGRSISEFATTKDSPRRFMEAVSHGEGFIGEDKALCADGSTFDMQISASLVKDQSGNPICLMASFVDVTERRRAEERQSSILSAIPLILYTAETPSPFDATWMTPNVESVTGYAAEAFVKREGFWSERMHPDDADRVWKAFAGIREGREMEVEYRWQCSDGTYRWFLDKATSIRRGTDGTIEYSGIWFDIHERRQAEELLRASEERYRTLAQTLPDAVTVMDMQGSITYASPAALKLYGDYTDGEVLGKKFHQWVHADYQGKAMDTLRATLTGGTVLGEEFQLLRKDGSSFFGDVSATRLVDGDGNPTGVIVIVRDISERKRSEAAVKHSLSLLEATLESTGDGILVVDRSGTIVDFNQRFQQMMRIPDDVIASRDDATVLAFVLDQIEDPESYRARVNELYEQPLAEGYDVLRFRDGRLFERFSLPQRIGMLPVGRVWSFRDLTQRSQAEQALLASERRYQTLTETSPVGIFRTDPTGYTTYVNPQWCLLSGLRAEEALGNGWLAAVHPADRENIGRGWSDATDVRTSSRAEYRFVRPDGRIVWVMGQAVPEIDARGEIVGYVGTITDITVRKEAEETRRLLSHTMESIAEIATITDLQNRLTFVNDSFIRTYGYERSEVLGRDIGILWSPNNPPELLDEILRESKTGMWKGEILNITKSGREFPLSLHTSQVKDEQGNILGLVGIAEDITVRKQLEAQLHQAQKMEAVGRLAGGVAHDFNNMIAVILGYATLMDSTLNPLDPLRKNLQAILSAADRSAKLTKQLLAFARKQVIAPVPLNLNESLTLLQRMLTRLIGEDIDLQLRPGTDLWTVKIDPTQVDQILTNLATNARDAIENVGRIVVETSNVVVESSGFSPETDIHPGEYVLVTFSDTGKGMDKATRERIFEPFFTTKPEGKGTGLGLATVFGIVKQNNGFIHVYSEPNTGTTFRIYLPRFHGDASSRPDQRAGVPLKGTETILVVEDEDQLLDLTCTALEQYGYVVLKANSPGEALLQCERTKGRIDLLLTDVILPGMNGKELQGRLLAMKPEMRVLFMSGYTADIVAHRGILEDGVSFLQKPFTPHSLASKVREVLGGGAVPGTRTFA